MCDAPIKIKSCMEYYGDGIFQKQFRVYDKEHLSAYYDNLADAQTLANALSRDRYGQKERQTTLHEY